MKRVVTLTESDIKRIILEVYEDFTSGRQFNIGPVWHCGDPLSNENFKDVIWFSDKPLGEYFGKPHKFMISIHKPLIVPPYFTNWCEKLWGYCCDEDGSPNKNPDDPSLTRILPAAVWDIVQKSNEELEIGDVPSIVAKLVKKGELDYDGVIIREIGETCDGSVDVDDYCVFSMEQVKPIA